VFKLKIEGTKVFLSKVQPAVFWDVLGESRGNSFLYSLLTDSNLQNLPKEWMYLSSYFFIYLFIYLEH